MFSRFWAWLKAWFVKPDDSIYQPTERLIYSYFNGEKLVIADPQVLYRALMDVAPELSADINTSNSQSKFWKQANDNAVKNVRNIFSIKPLPEGGLGELELFELLFHFIDYCDRLKKVRSPSQMSSVSLAAPIPTSEVKSQPIDNTLASGSTEKEPSTVEPEPSPTEPVLL